MIHWKPCFALACGGIIVSGMSLWKTPYVHAMPTFKKEFDSMYVKPDSRSPAEKQLALDVERVKCNVCHLPVSKKERNAYGKALSRLLKKTDKDDKAKIDSALEKVSGMKVNPDDPESPTFGELIRQGRLPGGEPPASAAQ